MALTPSQQQQAAAAQATLSQMAATVAAMQAAQNSGGGSSTPAPSGGGGSSSSGNTSLYLRSTGQVYNVPTNQVSNYMASGAWSSSPIGGSSTPSPATPTPAITPPPPQSLQPQQPLPAWPGTPQIPVSTMPGATGATGVTGATTPGQQPSQTQYFNNPAIKSRDLIIAGQPITVNGPNGGVSYQIKPGDSLSGIARQFGTTVDAILASNNVGQGFGTQQPQIPAIGANTGQTDPNNPQATPEAMAQAKKEKLMADLQALLDKDQLGAKNAITDTIVKAPEAPNYETEYGDLRSKYGVEPLEAELADIDRQVIDLQALYETAGAKEGERLAPMATIQRRKNKISEEQKIELDRLTRQKIAIQEQLNTKYKTIDTMMNLKGKTYDDAYQQYTTQYNQAIQAQQLMGQEKDDARASLTTMMNMFSGSGITWDSLAYDQQLGIMKLEMTTGIPVGTIQAYMQAKPNSKPLSIVNGVDAQGNAIVSFVSMDANGNPVVSQSTPTGGYKAPAAPKSTTTDQTKLNAEIAKGVTSLKGGESWGTVWNRIKALFPNADPATIDNGLGLEWKEPGAYQKYKATTTAKTSTNPFR